MHLFIVPAWFHALFCFGIALIAFWKGGPQVRVVAATTLVVGFVAPYFGCFHYFACPAWRELAGDGLMLAICLACLARAERYWLVWATSFALLSVITDLLGLVPGVTFWAFASLNWIWLYLLNLAVLWGAWEMPRARAPMSPATAPTARSAERRTPGPR